MDVEGIVALGFVSLSITDGGSEAVEAVLGNATPDLAGVVREETLGEVSEAPGERSDTVLGNKVDSNVVTAAVDPGGESSLDDEVHNLSTLLLRFFSEGARSDADHNAAFSLGFAIRVADGDAEGASEIGGA